MIKNKKLLVPLVSSFIILSLISVACGIKNNNIEQVKNDNKYVFLISTLLIILLIIFNCYIFLQRYEKPIKFIV